GLDGSFAPVVGAHGAVELAEAVLAPAVGDQAAGEPAALVGAGEAVGVAGEAEVLVGGEGGGQVTAADGVGELGGGLGGGAGTAAVADPVGEALGEPQRGGGRGVSAGGDVGGLVGEDDPAAGVAEQAEGVRVDDDPVRGRPSAGAGLAGGDG